MKNKMNMYIAKNIISQEPWTSLKTTETWIRGNQSCDKQSWSHTAFGKITNEELSLSTDNDYDNSKPFFLHRLPREDS